MERGKGRNGEKVRNGCKVDDREDNDGRKIEVKTKSEKGREWRIRRRPKRE